MKWGFPDSEFGLWVVKSLYNFSSALKLSLYSEEKVPIF